MLIIKSSKMKWFVSLIAKRVGAFPGSMALFKKHQLGYCFNESVILAKSTTYLTVCFVVFFACNKGNFGGGDDSQKPVKTMLEVVHLTKATQGNNGKGEVIIKAGNKLTAECVSESCKLTFSEGDKDSSGRFIYKAPFSYELVGKLADGETLKCEIVIKISGSKNAVDNKNRELGLVFCPDRGRDCDTKNVVKGCPIL